MGYYECPNCDITYSDDDLSSAGWGGYIDCECGATLYVDGTAPCCWDLLLNSPDED